MKLLRIAPLAPVCLALAGCPSALTQYNFTSESNYGQDKNARVAYLSMLNKNGPGMNTDAGQVKSGASSAAITANGANASLTMPDGSAIRNQAVARDTSWNPTEYYGDQDNSIVVERTAGLNEEGDTFLTYHEQGGAASPPSPERRELARGYAGTRSDASVVAALRNRTNHSATYTGTGSAYVGQDDYTYNVDGTLLMTARFAGANAGLTGQIMQTAAPDLKTNPNGVDQVTFTGKFIDNSPDYAINDIKLNATSSASTDNPNGQIADVKNGGGVGSFFGSHAQSTMGVFAGTGETTNDPKGSSHSLVNVIGSFQGTTTGNNPVP